MTAEDCGPEWDIRWINGSGLAVEPPPCGAPPEEEADEDAGPGLEERLLWQYPFAGDVEIPSKLTATQLKGRDLDGEAAEETPQPPRPVRFGRPRFASEEMGLTPAQRGTALHLVMQFIDFSRTETVEQVARGDSAAGGKTDDHAPAGGGGTPGKAHGVFFLRHRQRGAGV